MTVARTFLIVLILLVSSPAVGGDNHVVDDGEILRTLSASDTEAQAERQALLDILDSPQTRAIADAHDIDLGQARDAASTMPDADVEALTPYISQLDGAMAGGDRVVIGASTLIIILLVLLIIAVA